MTEAREDAGQLDITGWPSVPPNVTYRPAGKPVCYVLMKMRDGALAEGSGTSVKAAAADAARSWRRWKSRRAGPLAVDGREYQRRLKARRRRGA